MKSIQIQFDLRFDVVSEILRTCQQTIEQIINFTTLLWAIGQGGLSFERLLEKAA